MVALAVVRGEEMMIFMVKHTAPYQLLPKKSIIIPSKGEVITGMHAHTDSWNEWG